MQEIVDSLAAADEGAPIRRALLYPYLNHAATMFESGYATRDDIDAAMRFGCGYPIGPLALIDAVGAQTLVDGLKDLYTQTQDPLHEPAQVLLDQAAASAAFYAAGGEGAGELAPEFGRDIAKVGVVGTGTMASGIVEVFAKAGYDVTFVGRSTEKVDGVIAAITKSLDKAISRGKLDDAGKDAVLARLTGSTEREALGDVDIVVEAIAEDMELKLDLFRDLDRIAKPGAILATTTSSLSIQALADATSRPGDVVGLHFFNPAPIMKLVEIVSADSTSPEVAETAKALSLNVGKHPVSCTDRAGFIVNALLFPYLNDAVKYHEATATSLADIDDALKATKLPMGPFELLDVVGNDVSLAIQQTLIGAFGYEGWQPAPLLAQKVTEGALGRKTKQGFHSY